MLACQSYTKAIDVWSVGCIFAELLGRKVLFPGDDYIAQLRLICEKLGRPPEEDLDFVTSSRAKRFLLSLPEMQAPGGLHFVNHAEEVDAMSLLHAMLQVKPTRRISVVHALEHPFMSSLHNPHDEPEAGFSVSFDFEEEQMDRDSIKSKLWNEIASMQPEISASYPSTNSRRRLMSPGYPDNPPFDATSVQCENSAVTGNQVAFAKKKIKSAA
jgi:mitogen-activated protein kinase 1/3